MECRQTVPGQMPLQLCTHRIAGELMTRRGVAPQASETDASERMVV